MAINRNNIIFDLGGVVFHWDAPDVIDRLSDDPSVREAIRSHVLHHPDWVDMDRGTLRIPEMIERSEKRFPFEPDLLNRFFTNAMDSFTPIPEAVALIRDLKDSGCSTFVLSNMPADFAEMLTERYDIWTLFDGVVFSCDIQLVKPDAAIFNYLIDSYKLEKHTTVFVDDMNVNAEAAEGVGIRAIQHKDIETTRELLMTLQGRL